MEPERPRIKFQFTASHLALVFVVFVAGISFYSWLRSRPSFLLFQAHSQLGRGDESSVIHEYQRLLSKKDLPKDKEIQYRKALGEFYVRGVQENSAISLYFRDESPVDHPYIKEAREEFQKVLALDPNDSLAHYYLGRIFLFQRLEKFAMEELEKARVLGPKNPEPLTFLSSIVQERGDALRGMDLARQALAVAPENDEARMALMSAYSLLGEHEKVLWEYDYLSPEYRKQPIIRARHAVYLAEQNYWDKARSEMSNALEDDPGNGWIKILAAQLFMEQGGFEQASAELSQAQDLMPKNIWPLMSHTRVWAALGRCEESARSSQLLMETFPRWPWSFLAGAYHHLCSGRDGAALSALNESIRLAPDFSEAISLKIRILLDKGQVDEVGALLRPLLDKKRNESEGYAALAESFYDQGEYGLCLDSAEAAISANRRNPWGFVWQAMAWQSLEKVDAAQRSLSEANKLRPFDHRLKAVEAMFWIKERNKDRAEEILASLIQKGSREPWLWLAYGDLQSLEGFGPESIRAYEQAIALRPYLLSAHLRLIEALMNAGEKERAASNIKKAFEINSLNKKVLAWRRKR